MTQRKGFAILTFALCASVANAQIGTIKTYAGNDSGAMPGDGGPATSAVITNPIGLAVDSSGNLYIAASGNSLIRQVNAATGVINTVAGGGTGGDGGLAIAAAISGPCDVKLDQTGNIYFSETCIIAEEGGGGGTGGGSGVTARIRRVDTVTGLISTIAGTTSSGFSGDGGPATGALLSIPAGLAIDAANNIFIADSGNHRIRRIDAVSGLITTVAGNGVATFAGDGGPAIAASLNSASGIAVDAKGNLYIADTVNNRIRRVDAISGVITTVAGTGTVSFNGDGIAATAANLNTPVSVMVNGSGNVVFTDLGNNRVRFIDNAGLIWTLAGDGTAASSGDNGQATLATLNGPAGLAVSSAGILYVSEIHGDHVRQIALPSSVAATALTISSAATTYPQNSPVTIVATLAASNGTPYNATGGVMFFDGTAPLNGAPVANGAAQYTTSTLALGTHTISAVYFGDSNYGGSYSAVFPITVSVPAPTVSLSVSPNPSTANQTVTLTASVSNWTTGAVTFYNGMATLGSAPISAGIATLSGVQFGAGSYSLTAQYAQVTSPATALTVKASSTVTLISSLNPANVNQALTFTAAVTPPTATGTVQFSDGSTVLGTATVSSGSAVYSTLALTAGNHSITAVYSGDANDQSAGSNAVALVVLASTSVMLASSQNPATSNTSITFTATVAPTSSAGTVQFLDGSTLLGSGTLASGVASYSTSAITQGNHTIVATYLGDSTHAASSGSLSQAVKSAAALTEGVSPSPALAGQTVTITANVNASATGSVTFTDGGTTLATVPVSSGRATYSTAVLAKGVHTLGFAYSGDANYFAASTSMNETVQAASTVALTSSANPSTTGQSVTFTATVTPSTATGTVQFLDGSTVIGTASLNSGIAAFSSTSLVQGSHSIVASYGGDANDSAASSATLTQTVTAPAPPAAPSSLTATSAGSSQINLAWTASSTSGVTYNVYVSTTSGFTPSSSNRLATSVTATTYSAASLSGSTIYYFRVTAVKAAVESTASNQASAATSGSTACHVVYSVSSQWGNGFNGAFSIQNTGSSIMTAWTLTWSWAGNQAVTQAWNANYKQTGANVTMTNMSYNNSIAPGATLSGMGFGASYSGTNGSPTAFYVNGTLCH